MDTDNDRDQLQRQIEELRNDYRILLDRLEDYEQQPPIVTGKQIGRAHV